MCSECLKVLPILCLAGSYMDGDNGSARSLLFTQIDTGT